MSESPYEIYWRKLRELEREEAVTVRKMKRERAYLEADLSLAQRNCNPHIDNGAFIYGSCKLCGYFFG